MSMTLRDLLARGTPLDWFESVAIVQELAAAVKDAAGAGGPRVPDLPGARIEPDGTVSVTDDGSADQAPVFRLAHVLNALLSGGSPPVQLRLIVLTALSPEPTYKTLHDLTQALEYFERPDRRDVIRRVYERAAKLPAPAAETDVPALPDRPETPRPEPKQRRSSPWSRGRVLLAALAPIVVALVAGGWWWTTRPAGARVLSSTKQIVSRAVASTVDTIRNTFGGEAPAAAVDAPPPVVEAKPVPRAKPRFPRPLQPARSVAQDQLAPPVVTLAPAVEPSTWATPPEGIDEVVWLDLGPAATAGGTPHIYSEADADVRPPVGIRPMLPSDPPPGVPLEALTRLEVLVSATGEVESVRILAGPRSPLDGMMLSAVKAWQFQPATKDGRPVPYRHQVWLTNR